MVRGAVICATAAIVVGCNAMFGVDDLELAGAVASSTGSTAGAGGAGMGGSATSAGGASGGNGGSGAHGGSGGGGVPPVLVDRGIVARYFIDEADIGQAPTELLDSGPAQPVDIPITYFTGMNYKELLTGRGLVFPTVDHDGWATEPVSTTKLRTSIEGSNEATLELVFDADAPIGGGGILFMLMPAGVHEGKLGLDIRSPFLSLELNDTASGADASAIWAPDVVTGGRTIAHVVIDVTEATVEDRTRLYLGGVLAAHNATPPITVNPPLEDMPIESCDSCLVVLGNRTPQGDRWFAGTIFYAAVYNVAFTDQEITNNAAILQANDDTPPR